MRNIFTCILFGSLFHLSCTSTNSAETSGDNTVKAAFKKEETIVRTDIVKSGIFNQEIISNGKVFAVNNAEIKFPVNQQILKIYVRNGQHVRAGEVLAVLDDTDLRNKLNRSKEALDKAVVELDDRLIDYGYRLKDSAKVPVEIMRMARIKSGYNSARYDYADALVQLSKTKITAPFSGKVANLEAREYNFPEVFKRLCTLIDDSRMQVEFSVLETEFSFISKKSVLEITPFGNDVSLTGVVSEINPLIDDNGMIKITGTASNSAGYLLDGMSVKVIVRKAVPGKLYIPKEAVLQRQDRQVVFTYEDGLAKWNYVKTGLQNSKYVTIESGLKQGQQVIVSNNFNLAHDSEVTLNNNISAIE